MSINPELKLLGFLLAVLLALERQSRRGGRGEQHVGCGAVEAGRVPGMDRAVHEDHRDEAGHGRAGEAPGSCQTLQGAQGHSRKVRGALEDGAHWGLRMLSCQLGVSAGTPMGEAGQ